MPLIGIICGGLNFTDLKYFITPATADTAEAAIYYGNFIQSVVNFMLIAFVIFIIVKAINSLHYKNEAAADEPAPAPEPEDILLLREIRDLMKNKN